MKTKMKKAEKKIDEINSLVEKSAQKIKDEFRDVTEKTETFVKKNPGKTALISAGVGATVGAFLSNLLTKKEKKSKKSKK